jgi:hypothetical protein
MAVSSMRPLAFDNVDVEFGNEGVPFRSSQQSSRWPSIIRLALLSCLAAAILLPQLTLAVHAIALPDTRAIIFAHPLLALDLLLAIGLWIGLFGWPLKRLAAHINSRRDIEIAEGQVSVQDRKSFSEKTWSAPLKSYSGIAHHLRTSLTGTRHELILVHPEPQRSVLLMVSEHISASDIARFSRILGLPEVSPRELYSARRPQPASHEPACAVPEVLAMAA